ncbi:hypothetical protein GCM10010502_61930 [Kitasatospora aureofaciens]|uniref:Uncharacterized protein n=1 Tax=Kitasatospora aureofaciens TaxID=1894 RepID=A0A8H9HYI7_KITAU|nr:hypothetical protein B6264_30075 [Kitasatospora aureofaciens]GGU99145.1 hypothetical protein GCM10010502_61930 [Kitasatospora aureofaciens]
MEVPCGPLARPVEAFAGSPGRWPAAGSASSGSGAASEVVVIGLAFRQQEAGTGAVAGPAPGLAARVPPTLHTAPLTAV